MNNKIEETKNNNKTEMKPPEKPPTLFFRCNPDFERAIYYFTPWERELERTQ